MKIEPYNSTHADAVAQLSLSAWSPVFDSLKESLAPAVWEQFYPDGWRASQVDPDYQRRGIAMSLTDFAVDRMKEAGMEIAMVETGGDWGHAPARAAYEKAGFRVLPLARYFKKL